ncbi:peptidase inhibitor family I36 protein [Streptomyces sp. NPDC053253]|uniref:peptidase inhibitor family I36 protein n=1 Tax=Streptomyces sp. NPDC053253 TaxID=3365699 RepID=UPI0037CEA1E4
MSVTVYVDVDYKGKSATLKPGRHKLDPSLNDSISSVRVPDGWTVTLYEHADFTGKEAVLEADTARVAEALHDKASSILVKSDDDGEFIFSAENGDNWFYFEDESTN